MSVDVGQKVPNVSLIAGDRTPVRLADLLGRPTVLLFFPGAFTGVCTKEMCTFRDDLSRFNDLGAQVLAISVDSPYAQQAFKEANGLNFPLLSDFTREAVKAFGVEDPNFLKGMMAGTAKRSAFVVDANGTVTYRWVSDNPGVEPNYDEVAAAVKRLT
ncbi:MAG TPA: peroxiredoxin [bacterium]|jgi:peroxiredoxin|nr:peroxiredoxin [bacterium]